MSKSLVDVIPTRKGDRFNLLTNNRECVQAYRPTVILQQPFIKRAKNNDQLVVLIENVPAEVQDEQIERLYQAYRGPILTNLDRDGLATKVKDALEGAIKEAADSAKKEGAKAKTVTECIEAAIQAALKPKAA